MENGKLSQREVVDLIFYGAKENGMEPKDISTFSVSRVYCSYLDQCSFVKNYVRGKLDTFKRAACLLTAIYNYGLSGDREVNASIAATSALKMCEAPYWYGGKYHDVAIPLEEAHFQKSTFSDIMKDLLVDSLCHSKKVSPLPYSQQLELIYQITLKEKQLDTLKRQANLEYQKKV